MTSQLCRRNLRDNVLTSWGEGVSMDHFLQGICHVDVKNLPIILHEDPKSLT